MSQDPAIDDADLERDDDPLWKRILSNEFLWAGIVALVLLGVAFYLATGGEKAPR